MKHYLSAAIAVALGTGGADAKVGGPHNPCDLAVPYYVDDVVIVANPAAGPLRVRLSLDAERPAASASDHRYFEIDAGDMATPLGAAYIAMLSSRLRDRTLGVEPKCKTGANAGRDGSIGAPLIIGQLSFGALPHDRRR